MSKQDVAELRERARLINTRLEEIYPIAECALEYDGQPWKLLVMGRLSAQCKDERVNLICKELFSEYPTPDSLAGAEVERVKQIIFSCGLYEKKARDIISCCSRLVNVYNSVLPDTMEELLTFDGVGRKVANLLLGDIYKKPAVVVDTHCIRISRRLGLVEPYIKQPEKIEKILSVLIEPEKQSDFCHRIVLLGREYCPAKKYDCSVCPMAELCRKVKV